jgi:hypothetical protein
MLEKGEFEPVEKLIKDAVQISLTKDMGTDYFGSDPEGMFSKIFQHRRTSINRMATTGSIVVWWIQPRRTQHLCRRVRIRQIAGDDEHCTELVTTRIQWCVHHIRT